MILWIAGISMFLAGVVFVALTLVGVPGIWLVLLMAVVWEIATPTTSLFTAWSLGIAAALVLLAEVVDFAAGAVGAKIGGGGKRAAWGAVIGAILGAIVGTFVIPIPVVGSIAGAAIGSGAGAMIGHLDEAETKGQLVKVGSAAAAGRLVAIVIKLVIGLGVVLVLSIGAVIKGF